MWPTVLANMVNVNERTNKNKTVEKFFVVTWWKFCSHSIVCLKDIRTFVNTPIPAWLTCMTHTHRHTHMHKYSRKRVHVVLFMARL